MEPKYWLQACQALSEKDWIMAEIIQTNPRYTLKSKKQPFITLVKAIVGQQVSVAAADAIFGRLEDLCLKKINPESILSLEESQMRLVGLSRQKIMYLKNIAQYFQENKITNKYFSQRSSLELAQELLSIKGIGKWTLEMFQIFYLMEPDVFPVGDIGLISAIKTNYHKDFKDIKEIVAFSEIWRPYRTVATWYLWRTIDAEVVHY